MPQVEYYPRRMKRQCPLTIGKIGLDPHQDEDPSIHLISEEAIAETVANPFFAQEWQRLQDDKIVVVLDLNSKNPADSEPDITELTPAQAVKRVKATTSIALLKGWRDLGLAIGVERAIDARLKEMSLPIELKGK
jgi:hypothetical protein